MAKCAYPECGKVINTHGCRGGVKVEPWCDSPAVFAALPRVFLSEKGQYRPLTLRRASVFRSFVFAEFEGVETMEAAEALRGKTLYALREDLGLPEDTVLLAELCGMPVFDEAGRELGRIREVIHPADTDIYVVDTPRGEAMVPAVSAFVRKVSGEGIVVSPIEGMFP